MRRTVTHLVLWLAASAAAVAQAPVFAPGTHDETFFGTRVADPYRALEDVKDSAVQAWMKGQDEHARAQLARIPGRAELLRQLEQLDASVPARVSWVTRETYEQWFYLKRGVGDNQLKLMQRSGVGGAERVLFDPQSLQRSTGKPHAINYYTPAPSGRFVAFGVSAQGSEAAVLQVLDARDGRILTNRFDRADFGGVSWTPDARQFAFNRLQALEPGAPATDKFQRSQVWLWQPGQGADSARPIFGLGVPGVEIAAAEIPVVSFTNDGLWALGYVINGTAREWGLYLAPAAGVRALKPVWTRLFDASAAVTGLAYKNNTLYLLTHKDAPRSRVLALDLAQASMDNAREVVAQSERVVTGIAAASDALYLEVRDGNVKRLFKRAYAEASPLSEVTLPTLGSFRLSDDESFASAADSRLPGLVIELQSWTRARQIFEVTAEGRVRNTGLQPQGPFDAPEDLVATEVKLPSHDGALVPLSIIHHRDVALDGRNPTLLYGYASYGVSEEPTFSATRLAWLRAGGVLAVANPRGSGVYGEQWYRGGFQATKPNSWRDFIACAEWLIAQRYTTSARLGILGGSAGGILVGRAMTERPELFGAVVVQVGSWDMVRAETTPNGVPNIPEFGSRGTEAGFKALWAMSSLHHIRDSTRYPAVLLTHGMNDPRVEVWNSTKAAARLQAANAGPAPVLLRLDWDAGHGIGNTRAQQMAERADLYAFMLWRLGVEGYQPK